MSFGFRLRQTFDRPPEHLVDGFRGAISGNVGDALGRSAAMAHMIKPVTTGMGFAGVAFTVKSRPADNLVVWKALQVAQPGDVVVIATGHYYEHALFGDMMTSIAAARGLRALVTDGAVRDTPALIARGFPVFAAAATPNSPQKDGPSEMNVPVTCGGQLVSPGDIIVGDDDGVVVVPLAEADTVLTELRRVQTYERDRMAEIDRGQYFPEWIDRLLEERGAALES